MLHRLLLAVIISGLLSSACERRVSPTISFTPGPVGVAGAVKLFVDAEGAYELTAADLQSLNPAWGAADPHKFQLFDRGQARPLWVENHPTGFSLRFYGQPSDSRYTTSRVYVLSYDPQGQGLPMPAVGAEPAASAPIDLVHTTARFEHNDQYAPQVEAGDHFFWQSLPAPQTQTYELTLPEAQPGPARLRVELWASTSAPVSPDHHVRLTLNGQSVADAAWDGAGRRTLEAELPDGVLAGTNTLGIDLPGDTGAPAEIVFLDWIEFSYPRRAAFAAGALLWTGEAAPVQLTGFNGPLTLWDVTAPESVASITVNPGEGGLTFQGQTGHRYLAVEPQGLRKPSAAPLTLAPDLRAAGRGADWVAVGPADLLAPLQPLADWRAAQGLQTALIPLDAVADQFGAGYPEPEAIQSFVQYAARSWQPAPRFLLLVGDATYDPRGYTAPAEANRLPGFFIQTTYGGETVSDVLFGQVNADPWPDLAIGRLPARDTAQVSAYAAKSLAYEQNAPAGDWQRRVLAVADGQDPAFSSDAQAFLDVFASGYSPVLYAPAAGATDASAQVKAYLGEGYVLVAYFGHGSVNMWGKDRLFTTDDAATLTNSDYLPVVVNMNCLTGLYTHPKVISLAEALLWQPSGGAVAVLAPSSLTLPADQAMLSSAFAASLVKNPGLTLGEWLLQAQRQMPVDDSAGGREVMLTFLLFGDPALRLSGGDR
jgi:hypothetical protein